MRVWIAMMVAAFALPGAALADEGCQTQAKAMTCAPAGSAHLSATTGDVLMSRGVGFSQVKPGTALVAGDRLLVKQGKANLALGPSCQTQLGANSMVTLVEKDGVLCAAQLAADPETVAQRRREEVAPTEGVDLQTAGLVVGGLSVGIMAIVATRGGESRGRVPPRLSP